MDYEIRYLDISNVNSQGIVDHDEIRPLAFADAPSRARRKVKKFDTVISSVRTNLQAVAHIDFNMENLVASTGFFVCRPKFLALVQPKYLYFFLLTEYSKEYFFSRSIGISYPAIDDYDFGSIHMPVPPIEEQQAIVGFLEKACKKIDVAIQVKREQIRKNEVILDSVIQHAVTKGLNPDVPLRDSGISWIGKIPTHWQVKKLKRILAEVDYGISESSKSEGKHAVLKMGNIVKGEIAYTKIEYVDTVSPDLILRKDDLLFNRTNSHDQVGKVGIFRDSEEDQVTFASYLVRLRPNHSSNPHYLNHYLNTDAFLGIARKMAIPSVQQANLNPTRYGRLEVAVPPLAEQIEIAAYLDKKLHDIRQVADTLQQQISVLEAYKKSVVHECVTGKKQVWRGDWQVTSKQGEVI